MHGKLAPNYVLIFSPARVPTLKEKEWKQTREWFSMAV